MVPLAVCSVIEVPSLWRSSIAMSTLFLELLRDCRLQIIPNQMVRRNVHNKCGNSIYERMQQRTIGLIIFQWPSLRTILPYIQVLVFHHSMSVGPIDHRLGLNLNL